MIFTTRHFMCFLALLLRTIFGLPIKSSSAITCADAPEVDGYICHDTTESDGTPSTIYIHARFFEPELFHLQSQDQQMTAENEKRALVEAPYGYTKQDEKMCDDITYQDTTIPTSPPKSDCIAFANWARSHPGRWYINWHLMMTQKWTPLAFGQYCALVAQQPGKQSEMGYYVGNVDVADFVEHSVDDMGSSGRIRSQGFTQCTDGGKNMFPVYLWLLGVDSIPTE